MPYYRTRSGKTMWRSAPYRMKRDKEWIRKMGDYIEVNNKLRMVGILFTAAYRSVNNVGTSSKFIEIYLYENKESHDRYDEKRYDRHYLSINFPSYFRDTGKVRVVKGIKRGKRKSQTVRV